MNGRNPLSKQYGYVICEINASSCFAIPDEAPAAIARLCRERLRGR